MRPGPRGLRRAVALALLSAFAAFLAAPLVHAGEAEGGYCAGDRCCCAPDAGDRRTCFRSVCRCGTTAREPALVSLGEGILPDPVQIPRVEILRFHVPRPPRLPAPTDPSPPFHPPPAV